MHAEVRGHTATGAERSPARDGSRASPHQGPPDPIQATNRSSAATLSPWYRSASVAIHSLRGGPPPASRSWRRTPLACPSTSCPEQGIQRTDRGTATAVEHVRSHMLPMLRQGHGTPVWQSDDPVLRPPAVAHQCGTVVEIEVLHPQAYGLHQPRSRPVQETGHQPGRAGQASQPRPHLVRRQDRRQAPRLLRPHHGLDAGERPPEYRFVEEHQRIERLILCGGRHLAVDRQMREEGANLRLGYFPRVPLPMKQDETLDPAEVCLLRSDAVMPNPYGDANLLQERRPALPSVHAPTLPRAINWTDRRYGTTSGKASWTLLCQTELQASVVLPHRRKLAAQHARALGQQIRPGPQPFRNGPHRRAPRRIDGNLPGCAGDGVPWTEPRDPSARRQAFARPKRFGDKQLYRPSLYRVPAMWDIRESSVLQHGRIPDTQCYTAAETSS
jgi:hypothetical protein